MRNRLQAIGLAVGLAVFLLLGTLGSLAFAPDLQTSPDPKTITVNSSSVATDTNFSNYVWGRYTSADLFYRIDQGTVNTISLEIEVSPDGSNWYDHTLSGTLLADNVADANGYVASIPIHGWQWRIVANVNNTNTITPALKMVLR
jgi:hypothetical protein